MNILKRLFCKHQLKPIENDYIKLGYYKCQKCGKEKYIGDNVEFTHFHIGKIRIK